jgi:tetratricopeptide (TPR) repeat protein
VGGFLSTSLIADQFARAQKNFEQKKYDTAIKYYDSVIEDNEEAGQVESSNEQKLKAQEYIDDAKRLVKNGDILLEHGLYGRAEEEYLKAFDIYPLFEDIKQKIKNARQLKEKFGDYAAEKDYVLFGKGLKFNYDTMFPQWWGKVKVCDPQLAEFSGFTLEEGQFYKSEKMLKVSGKLEGLKQMDQYIESGEGLFTFISAYVVNNDGSVKWYKDGYLSGESPYLIEGQVRDFNLVSQLTVSLEPEDWLVIIAYAKSSMIVMTDSQAPEGPNGDRNAFAVYWAQIKDI